MVALRTGQPLTAQPLVEDAEKVVADGLPEAHQGLIDAMRRRWVIGDAAGARAEIEELASSFDVDEVMLHPVAGAVSGTDAGGAPARVRTLELLAPIISASPIGSL